MSTIHGTTELGPASARRQVYSPLETYWNAFQEWRKRQRLRATLCDLSDRELMDIGTTRGEIDYVASNRSIDPRGVRSSPPMNVFVSRWLRQKDKMVSSPGMKGVVGIRRVDWFEPSRSTHTTTREYRKLPKLPSPYQRITF